MISRCRVYSKGLVVPVIRNAESLSMWEIEKEVKRLALAGRDGKLSMEDMEGGTFSITNGGVFGSLMSTLFSTHRSQPFLVCIK